MMSSRTYFASDLTMLNLYLLVTLLKTIILSAGNIENEDEVLGFLTNEDSLTIPDKIEEVNAQSLERIVKEEKFVTVLFYDETKGSADVLNELENIDE